MCCLRNILAFAVLAGCGSEGAIETRASPVSSPQARPSIEQANWSGRWEFNYTLTGIDGVTAGETPFTLGSQIRRFWEVTPGCLEGPCNSEIVGTDPDHPSSGEVSSVVTYHEGSYRITQNFPPEPQQGCTGTDGRLIPGAFEATNVVEATPTEFEVREGKSVVTELTSTKVTTFTPTGAAEQAGGTCTLKTATWEGTVLPLDA